MFDKRVKVFSELANEFTRNGAYPYEDEYNEIYRELNEGAKTIILPTFDDYSPDMQEFALYWIDKFINGDEEQGCPIPGEYSMYLNTAWITKKTKNSRGISSRGSGFPDFWDEDYKYFWACEIGRYGITREKYEIVKSFCDLNLIETDENLAGGKDVLWVKPRGVGAEQPHSEILITPNGEITMGEVKVGTHLYDRFGNITTVTEVLPQGFKDVWEIELMDGRKVTCGENHLWTVIDRHKNIRTMTTKVIANKGLFFVNKGQNIYNFKLPKLEPVKFSEKELPIHPYVLGCLLGDGSMNGHNIKIASDDIEIVDRIQELLGDDYTLNKDNSNNNYLIAIKNKFQYIDENNDSSKFGCNPLKRTIEYLGLNVKCDKKFIPDLYKYSSIEQRLELIKGLMDTDGSISVQGYCEFSNNCEQLVYDLAYIIRSLGIYCSISKFEGCKEKTITDRNNKSCTFIEKDYYRLYIATNTNIFYLPRKANRINTTKFTKTEVAIVSIKKLNYQEEQSCIIVDNKEHLYLTKDFIITHNSWKGGNYSNYTMYLIPDSTTFIAADKKAYLQGDGIYNKFVTLNSFISEHCWWLKKNFIKESLTEFTYSTGTNEKAGRSKIVTGFKSNVIGIVVDGDKEKLRGKRGNILYEEFGSFPGVDDAWLVADAGTQEYGDVFGQRRGFGTGGDTSGGIAALKKMSYDPKTYRLLEFKDIYEDRKKSICFFTAAFRNIKHKDEFGNSNEIAGKEWLEGQLKILEQGTDLTQVTKFKAEYPQKLSDAFKNAGVNILPIELAESHLDLLEKTDLDRVQCTYGKLSNKGGYIGFDIDVKAKPYEDWPAKDPNKEGCISIFKKPYTYNGRVPKGLYIISVDGYTQDSTNGPSIGSFQVFEQSNKYTSYKGDCFVAWYDGRPEGFDGLGTFAKILFYLAEFYNAEVMLENDQVGDIVSYAKKNTDSKGKKLTLYLAEQPDLAFNEKIATKATMNRSFGINMTEERKEQGLKYYQEWLIKPRGSTENGNIVYNLQTIRSRGMLKEIIGFDGTNADRISSAIICMFHVKDNTYEASRENKSNAKVLAGLKLF